MPRARAHPAAVEAVILTGGLSRRMGRDKAALSLGGRSFTGHIRTACRAAGLPVRSLRRDLRPGLGPIGGIHTALATTRATQVVVLSCDMPLITPELLQRLLRRGRGRAAAFRDEEGFGFPWVIPARHLGTIEALIASGQRSLQRLSAAIDACPVTLPAAEAWQRRNINTPADLAALRRWWRERSRGAFVAGT